MEIPNDKSSFVELSDYVYREFLFLKLNDSDILNRVKLTNSLYRKIEKDPIVRRNIIKLSKDGWKVHFGYRFAGSLASCCYEDKEIWILPNSGVYETDKALCHEIVHAIYGSELTADVIKPIFDESLKLSHKSNNALVEWYARQIRATPSLLTSIWETFSINPRIYDKASLLATKKLSKLKDNQLLFPSFELDYDFTLMD